MLASWEAERLDKVLESGRTKPFVAECVPADLPEEPAKTGESQGFVVKGLGNPHVNEFSLFNEVVGNLLAKRLGVNTPDPALIKVKPTFAKVASEITARYGYQVEPGTSAGAAYLGTGLIPATNLSVNEDTADQIMRIYAFDVVMQNPDRRKDKPNCIVQRDRIIAIDFELCFSFTLVIGNPSPYDFANHGISWQHLFHSSLAKKPVDWKPFIDALLSVTEKEMAAMVTSVPVEWRTFAIKVQEHVLLLQERPTEVEMELQRSLR